MQTINRLITNICSEKLPESKAFYTMLFELEVAFDSDWYVQLVSKEKGLEFAFIGKGNDVIPKEAQADPAGLYLTFVVEDVDKLFEVAQSNQLEVVEPPTDTFYGQRRMLLKDPNGVIVDVSSLIKE